MTHFFWFVPSRSTEFRTPGSSVNGVSVTARYFVDNTKHSPIKVSVGANSANRFSFHKNHFAHLWAPGTSLEVIFYQQPSICSLQFTVAVWRLASFGALSCEQLDLRAHFHYQSQISAAHEDLTEKSSEMMYNISEHREQNSNNHS